MVTTTMPPWVGKGERAVKFQSLSTGTFAVMQSRAITLPYKAWLLQVIIVRRRENLYDRNSKIDSPHQSGTLKTRL